MATKIQCTTADLTTPEFLGQLIAAHHKENRRLARVRAARRALSICNRLTPSPFKAKHNSRIFSALNKLRAA